MQDEILSLLPKRNGHFRLESGHHGNLWLELELLCLYPKRVQPLAAELAARLARHRVEAVCGPLVEGAYVALLVAAALNVEFAYAERFAPSQSNPAALYPVTYRIPGALRGRLRGKRVAIVNDVINAGSSVRGTFADLLDCGAQPVVVGAFLVLGSAASTWAVEQQIPVESLATLPNNLWRPSECPLCSAGVPIDKMV